MHPAVETALYIAIFIGLYFEVFALLTYLSRDARERRLRQAAREGHFPEVAVIVPCYNEETTVVGTVNSLLALDYPAERLSVIIVDDGSIDGTPRALARYAADPRVTVIRTENRGKHEALNTGMRSTAAPFVACLDADSFVHRDALREAVTHFTDETVGAVTSSLTVHNPQNPLERMQYAEYLMGVSLRHILSAVNGLYVTPGPFSLYRRDVVERLGGFRSAHNTEDMEIAMRMQKAGYRIENAPRSLVFTKAPTTVRSLVKQRTRWTTGFIRNGYDYRELFGNPRYGALGLLVLPLGVFAIVSGIGLFVLLIVRGISAAVDAITIQGDVPLAYVLQVPVFDWFFVPLSAIVILSLCTLLAMGALMALGRRLSSAPHPVLGISVIWYVLLYSFIAPLWLLRSVSDVTLGIRRNWR
jgi:cellulose synthase/poly-beta-1,6-N-acetylglucosamine synthase-like glycosyltransferase